MGMMASVLDVAQYILRKHGPMSTWKLQKLAFYAQAWHSVWADHPLFADRYEAWANGPVSPALYEKHRGFFTISEISGRGPDSLSDDEKTSVDVVIEFYGKYNGQQLSDLTHSENPWKNARSGLAPGERCNEEITVESMAEYYGSL